jgi:hypothetical protein
MFKPVARDFYEAAVADHERAAIECADPLMRQVWLATAAEWRNLAVTRPVSRRARKITPRTAEPFLKRSMGDVLAFVPVIAAAVVPESRSRELNELLAGQLIMDMYDGGVETVAAVDQPDPASIAGLVLDVHDLII